MLCLSFLLPGKAGKIIRKILMPIGAAVILYALCWALILKGLSMEPISSFSDEDTISVKIRAVNRSLGSIEIVDMNVYDEKGRMVPKRTEDLPVLVPSRESRDIQLYFESAEFDSVELTVKVLLLQRKLRNKMKR